MSDVNKFDGEKCTCLVSAVHPPSEDTKSLKVRIENMHSACVGKHSVVMVNPDDIGYALRALAAAYTVDPVNTSMTIVVPFQNKRRPEWAAHLLKYIQVGKVLDANQKKWYRIMTRKRTTRETYVNAIHSTHIDTLPTGMQADTRRKQAGTQINVAHDVSKQLYCSFDMDLGSGKKLVLADTGAERSIVTRAYARKAGVQINPSNHDLVGLEGSGIGSLGTVDLTLKLQGENFPVTLEIVPKLPGNLVAILGQELMQQRGGGVTFENDRVNFNLMKNGKNYKISRPCVNKTKDVLTKKQARQAHLKGVLGRVLITLPKQGKYISPEEIGKNVDSAFAMVAQRIFTEQTEFDPLLRPILEAEASVWESTEGLSERSYQAEIDLLPGAQARMMRSYRLTPKERDELVKQITKMIEKGWIRPSSSSWGAPVLFAPKSDGGLRMCIDYRMLNAATVRNAHPLPHVQDALDGFAGAEVFSTLDLAAGFHQIVLKEESRHLTAFRTDQGLYEYNVMPMGLANAPAMFQKAMNDMLRPFMNKFVTVYMDDIIIYSKNMEEHAEHLKQVLAVMSKYGYKARKDKCCFGVSSVPFLGHVVSGKGLSVDPSKVTLVENWPAPLDVGQVRSFVGLVQYFKRFIKDLSTILVPLTHLTKNNTPFVWSVDCQSAFQQVKALLSTAPVLAMPDPKKRYTVYTDASIYGCGGVLMQEGRPVAYCGKKFDQTMTNWTTTEQELFGLVHALETWRCYLEGVQFDLFTDHQPLVWLRTQPNLSRKQSRWLLYIQRFDMDLKYIPGPKNPADALSRAPHLTGEKTPSAAEVQFDEVMADLDAKRAKSVFAMTAMSGKSKKSQRKLVFTFQTGPGHRSQRLRAKEGGKPQQTAVPQPKPKWPEQMTMAKLFDLRTLARSGMVPQRQPLPETEPILEIEQLMEIDPTPDTNVITTDDSDVNEADASEPEEEQEPSEELKRQVEARDAKDMNIDLFLNKVVEGYVHDKWFGVNENYEKLTKVKEFMFKDHALVLPDHGGVRQAAMYQMHDAPWAGHVGRERTKWALKQAYYWPRMDADVDEYVKSCGKCQRNKARHQQKENRMAPLSVPMRAWEFIGTDFIMFLPVTSKGFDAICVFSCHFTKMVHLVPCHSTITSEEFAKLFRRHIFRLHGLPKTIVSDRGTQFVSGMWRQLTADLGIQLAMSTAHQPSTDGQVERINKTLEEMLRSYVNLSHNDWDEWLDCAEFAINKSRAAATGCSPFELVFQHTPLSPPERQLENSLNPEFTDPKNKQSLMSRRVGRKVGQEWALRLRSARAALHSAKARMKDQADKHRKERILEVGDFALLNTKYLNLKKPSVAKKFCPVFVGPFEILKRIGRSAYKLKLPEKCLIHDVIHVSKLWKYNKAVGEDLSVQTPLWLDGNDMPEVGDILRARGTGDKRHYLVQYKNKDCMYATWEPERALMTTCAHLISQFKQRRQLRDPEALSFVITTARENIADAIKESPYRTYHRYVADDAQELQQFRAATL